MYCENCGAKVFPGQNYCRECGAAQEHNITEQRTQHRTPSSKYNNTKLVLILMTVCFFIPMICFIVLGNIVEKKVSPVGEEHVEEMNIEEEYIEESIVSIYHEEQVLQDETMPSVVKEPTMPEESFYIKRSRAIAEKEYDKYLEKEALARFTQKANSNKITLDMLNRQPGYYEGKEVYFGGTVLQAIYDKEDSSKVQLRIEDRNTTSTQNVVFVSYTLGEYETRILEDDYVDMYGTFDGMITYQSVGSGPITIPHVIGKVVYCYSDATGLQNSPTAQALEERVDGQFRGERGEIFSFATVKDAEMNYFSGPTDYGDCIVAYFVPEMGWDEYTNPPFLRVTAFKNGKLVVFEPNENAEAGVNSIDDGVYREYTFIEGSDQTQTTSSSYTPSRLPAASAPNATESKNGYVIESSGGLKIRSGPSTSYQEVGRLEPLDVVTIFETTYSDNRSWGRMDRGWVCMDYIVLGSPPARSQTNASQEIIDQFTGQWGDSVGQRCMMSVNYHNGSFVFDINWGSSAFETSTWHFVGNYDSSTNEVYYSNGIHSRNKTNDNGESETTVLYTNGAGTFKIVNGFMYWNDYIENQGENCVFEYFG